MAISPVAVVISLPFVVFVSIVVNPTNIRSVKVIPVIIASPIDISLRIAIIVTPVRVSCCIETGPGAND
jgi:hypothetical protein